jgi:ribonuclease G
VDDAPASHLIDEHLTEDEAAALAEHIAEAQEEQSDLESHGHEHDEHEDDAHHDHEDRDADDAHDEMHAGETGTHAVSDVDLEGAHEPHEGDESDSFESRAEALMAPDTMESEEGVASEETLDAGDAQADAILAADSAQQPPNEARVRNDFRSRMNNPARRGGRDRGRRDHRHGGRPHHHGHHRPHQPRKIQLIADMLKQGQEIIVQIAKEPLGKKGARITSHVALPGRFLVYMPTLDHTGVSRKIASAEERARLRHLVNEAKGTSGGGFIVRTAAASAAPEDVRADVEFLTRTWAEIKTRSESKKAPSLLHRDLNLVERILRDFVTPDFGAIWVDSEEGYTKVVDFMSRFQPQLVNRVKLYTKQTPVFEEFGIQQEIDKGLRPKVWLKSGGYIVINHTEALVAIDVNTGKFVGKGSNRLEDTIVRTNVEAVKEIVRQMRLRDLGGIIVIDFIDMEERRNRDKVMAALEDALRADRAPSKVLRFNEFGLVAITRKRTKQALERTLCQPCPYCTGSGMVKSIATLCYELQTEAMKMSPEMPSGSITLRVHPEISKALKTRESSLIEELERWTKKSVIIQADPTLHWEQYDIY